MATLVVATCAFKILGIIFSYLPRKSDLLNGRIVCRSWNQECLRVLQKPESGFKQILTESSMSKYLNFISNSPCLPELILPFYLKITITPGNTNPDPAPEEVLYKVNLNNLTSNVESLCAVFGEECIQTLSLTSTPEDFSGSLILFTKFWLIQFLKEVSRGLKILDLFVFAWRLGNYTRDEVNSEALKICDLNFPQLTTLICNGCQRYLPPDNAPHLVTHPIYEYIIYYSPNLENLKGIVSWDLTKSPINFNQLKSLVIRQMQTDPSEILEKFRQSNSSPVLQNLQIGIAHWPRRNHIRISMLHNIFECLSTTLNSLSINVPYDQTILERIVTFPRLPGLQYLTIALEHLTYVGNEDLLFLNPEAIRFNPETLPTLKSVRLPLGLILSHYVGSEDQLFLEGETEVPVKFTRVNELTIRISHNYWMSGVGLHKGVLALKHVLKVFPNISKLTVHNSIMGNMGIEQHGVKHLLQSLTQTPLSRNIHEICIEGFDEDFLGQVLGQMYSTSKGEGAFLEAEANNSFFMKNIRKIKLGMNTLAHIYCFRFQYPFPQNLVPTPNLTAMAKCFPLLQIIEISELLFRDMSDTERKVLIETLATTFPYLWIHRC